MTTKEQILAEIERRKSRQGKSYYPAMMELLSILDILPDEPVTDCHDLEEAKEEYLRKARMTPGHEWMTRDIEDAFKAGAEWQRKQMPMPEDTVLFQKGVEEGKRMMMEGAVEGEVSGRVYDHLNIRFADGVCKYLEPKNISYIPADVSKYNIGDKVKIVIVKEKEQ